MPKKKADAVYKIGKATVRIRGSADREKIKTATERYVKRITMEGKHGK